MARRRGKNSDRPGDKASRAIKHPLLIYYNLSKRYHGSGMCLLFLGIMLIIPYFLEDLNNEWIDEKNAAILGAVSVFAGLGLWWIARRARRNAYIQCRPDLMVVQTPFFRAMVSYRRIRQSRSVQVLKVFSREELRGVHKPLMQPLMPMTAVEVLVNSWPAPKRRLRRFMGKYLFSARDDAWFFIVPDYNALIRQLDVAMQRKLEAQQQATSGGYEDPFTRLKRYSGKS